jgi:asparagine synthase (glutamine-hydrolysing)
MAQSQPNHRKEGFVLPIDHWLLNDLRSTVEETPAPSRLVMHGLLNPERVRTLLDEHYSRAANHGPRIWNLMMFQRWWERFFAVR